jgi:hypothetical protein
MQAIINEEMLIIGGDILLSVEGKQVASNPKVIGSIKNTIKQVEKGGKIKLTLLRGGEVIDLFATRRR